MQVIVGIRRYEDDEVDVEVFADTPRGNELVEMFSRADSGITTVTLHEMEVQGG